MPVPEQASAFSSQRHSDNSRFQRKEQKDFCQMPVAHKYRNRSSYKNEQFFCFLDAMIIDRVQCIMVNTKAQINLSS